MLTRYQAAKAWVLKFIELHLFISALSLPILSYWGLPLSLVSIIGNLIFAPFLTVFLFVSSLLFFTEIAMIPNQFLFFSLEKIGSLWIYLLSASQKQWLIGFAKPPLFILLLMPIPAIVILLASRFISQVKRIALLVGTFFLFYLLCGTIFAKKETLFSIECGSQKLSAVKHHNKIVIFSTKALARIKSPTSWIDYTLIPTLIKMSGKTDIDHLIITMPGQKIFEHVTLLLKKVSIKNIHLILWDGTLDPKAWRNYFVLKETAQKTGCTIYRIGKKDTDIHLEKNAKLILKPSNTIKKETFSVSKITIDYLIDTKTTILL